MSGGGFGQPPGGGGGFGPPPGGGGFGVPPGGGGGFGQPPGGTPPPGGGGFGTPPPSGPGSSPGASGAGGSMKHIPFAPEEESQIRGAGTLMTVTAIIASVYVLSNLIQYAISSYVQFTVSAESGMVSVVMNACGGFLMTAIIAVFAVLLFLGGRDLKRVVDTDEDDQAFLMAAIERIRQVVIFKVVLILGMVALFCLLMMVGAGAGMAGAAMAGH